jgi:hypothetical protein
MGGIYRTKVQFLFKSNLIIFLVILVLDDTKLTRLKLNQLILHYSFLLQK